MTKIEWTDSGSYWLCVGCARMIGVDLMSVLAIDIGTNTGWPSLHRYNHG